MAHPRFNTPYALFAKTENGFVEPLFDDKNTESINHYFSSVSDYVYDSFVTDLNNIRSNLADLKMEVPTDMTQPVPMARTLFFDLICALENCPGKSSKLSGQDLANDTNAQAILAAAKAFKKHMDDTPEKIQVQDTLHSGAIKEEKNPLTDKNIHTDLQWEEIKKWALRVTTVIAFVFGGGLVAGALLATKMGMLGYLVGGPIGGAVAGAVAFKMPSIHDYGYDRFFKGEQKSIAEVGMRAAKRVVTNIPDEKKDAPTSSPKSK